MPDTAPLPLPAALGVLADRVHALADQDSHPILSRRAGGAPRRVARGARPGPLIAVGWLTRREAEVALAEWCAAMPEGAP